MSSSSLVRASLIAACLQIWSGCTPIAQTGEPAALADSHRGSLLYDTVCVACHTTQPHWRDKRVVHSWADLVFQVSRWQGVAGQNWSAADINDAAAYLNERFYHLACPVPGCSRTPG